MSISDGSSDVCASYLLIDIFGKEHERAVAVVLGVLADWRSQIARGMHHRVEQHGPAFPALGQARGVVSAQRRADHDKVCFRLYCTLAQGLQIGRASCRARVCQYV